MWDAQDLRDCRAGTAVYREIPDHLLMATVATFGRQNVYLWLYSPSTDGDTAPAAPTDVGVSEAAAPTQPSSTSSSSSSTSSLLSSPSLVTLLGTITWDHIKAALNHGDDARNIHGSCFNCDGTLLFLQFVNLKYLLVVDVHTLRLFRACESRSVLHMCASRTDTKVATTTTRNKTVWLWNVPNQTDQRLLRTFEDTEFVCYAFSPDGSLLLGADARSIKLWPVPGCAGHQAQDAVTVPVLSTEEVSSGDAALSLNYIEMCVFSPDCSLVGVARSDVILLYAVSTMAKVIEWSHQTLSSNGEVKSIEFSVDVSKLLGCLNYHWLVIWDCSTGDVLHQLRLVEPRAAFVHMFPDCFAVVSADKYRGRDQAVAKVISSVSGKEMDRWDCQDACNEAFSSSRKWRLESGVVESCRHSASRQYFDVVGKIFHWNS
jgi:WD40 repeat protein